MPSPLDLRIWHLSHVLGWATRRIGDEVGVSQPTVVRKLHRLEEHPPTDEEMQAFVTAAVTPPHGLPAISDDPATQVIPAVQAIRRDRPASSRPLILAAALSVTIVTLAIAALLAAVTARLLKPPAAPAPAAPAAGVAACARYDAATGLPVIYPRSHGTCATWQSPVIITPAP